MMFILFKVLIDVQKELIHYGTSKISVMEMSHRSSDYGNINNMAQQTLRELL